MKTVFSKRSLTHSDSERLRFKIIHSASARKYPPLLFNQSEKCFDDVVVVITLPN